MEIINMQMRHYLHNGKGYRALPYTKLKLMLCAFQSYIKLNFWFLWHISPFLRALSHMTKVLIFFPYLSYCSWRIRDHWSSQPRHKWRWRRRRWRWWRRRRRRRRRRWWWGGYWWCRRRGRRRNWERKRNHLWKMTPPPPAATQRRAPSPARSPLVLTRQRTTTTRASYTPTSPSRRRRSLASVLSSCSPGLPRWVSTTEINTDWVSLPSSCLGHSWVTSSEWG